MDIINTVADVIGQLKKSLAITHANLEEPHGKAKEDDVVIGEVYNSDLRKLYSLAKQWEYCSEDFTPEFPEDAEEARHISETLKSIFWNLALKDVEVPGKPGDIFHPRLVERWRIVCSQIEIEVKLDSPTGCFAGNN